MEIGIAEVSLKLVAHFIDNWTETPACEKGASGVDITGATAGDLFDVADEFVEINVYVAARRPTGLHRESGVAVLGYFDVQMYTKTGGGTIRLARIEQAVYDLLERKTVGSIEIRAAISVGKPYEIKGKLTKAISFPFEYFQK